MLDKKMEMMLSVANLLTAEDLETLRAGATGTGVAVASDDPDEPMESEQEAGQATDEPDDADINSTGAAPSVDPVVPPPSTRATRQNRACMPQAATNRGEYERQRTRESKISTKGMENKVVILTDVALSDRDFHRDLFYTGLTRATESVRVLCDKGSQETLLKWLAGRSDR